MKQYYAFIQESNNLLDPSTKWTHNGQYNIIKEILQKYPTSKDFKNAVIQTNNQKAISLVQSLPDNCSRNEYIDFLQNVFVKYSRLGKILLSTGIGIGVGALVTYGSKKLIDSYNSTYDWTKRKRDAYQDSHDYISNEKSWYDDNLSPEENKEIYNNVIKPSIQKNIQSDSQTMAEYDKILERGREDHPLKTSLIGGAYFGIPSGLITAGLGKLFDRKRVDDLKQ